MAEQENYGAESIQVLEGLEAVRKRPAMYIGDISVKGLHRFLAKHFIMLVGINSIPARRMRVKIQCDIVNHKRKLVNQIHKFML